MITYVRDIINVWTPELSLSLYFSLPLSPFLYVCLCVMLNAIGPMGSRQPTFCATCFLTYFAR